jgi:hypothetical protein
MALNVYTVTETTDRTGYVLGVFAERAMALDAGLSWAQHRINHCLRQDEAVLGHPPPADTYVIAVDEPDEHASITIIHQPSGETDGLAWQIWPFDVVERERPDHAQIVDPLVDAA